MYVDKATFHPSSFHKERYGMGTVSHVSSAQFGSVLAWANGTHNGCPENGPFNNCCWLKIESVVKPTWDDSDEWDYSYRHLYPPNNTVYVPCYWRVEDEEQ